MRRLQRLCGSAARGRQRDARQGPSRWCGRHAERRDERYRERRGGPTAPELRGEIWDAILHGARGIFYFADQLGGGGTSFTWDGTPPANVDELTKQNALVTTLAPVLQGAIEPGPWSAKVPAPLEVAWRNDAGSTYFFVLNLSPTAKTKQTIMLTGVTSTTATLFFS